MATADGGHGQICQSLVLLAHEDSQMGSSPRRSNLLKRKICIYMFLFTVIFPCHLDHSTSVSLSTAFYVEEQELFYHEEHAMLWLGSEYNTGGR